MSYDHNDIYNIVERLAILEGRITPTTVKHGLNKQQQSVPQLPALFKPKDISPVLGAKEKKHPMAGYMVGDSFENNKESVEEDVLDKVKASFADYLSSVADEMKQDTDLKDKKKDDTDLKKKEKKDRDLIAKEDAPDQPAIVPTTSSSPGDETGLQPEIVPELEEGVSKLEVGDPITVTAPNEYKGKTGEITEFSPSGKFVVVKLYNGDEASMHVSDVEYNEYADEQDVADAWGDDEPIEIPVDEDPTLPESKCVKSITNECGIWEVHGNEADGFNIHREGRSMPSRFNSLEEAEMALEMFAARKRKAGDSADYIEEA